MCKKHSEIPLFKKLKGEFQVKKDKRNVLNKLVNINLHGNIDKQVKSILGLSDGELRDLKRHCKNFQGKRYFDKFIDVNPGKIFDKATKRTCIGENNFYCGTRTGSKYQNNQCVFRKEESTDKYRCINRLDISEKYVMKTLTFDKKVSSPRWNFFKTFKTNDTHIWCGNESRRKD